ncbi:hypothetical protein CYLTODRAFT_392375 [Cylindrobasidium torrendii FP15055 ss-10]|uniref:Calcium uniporter protein, mitochondrial n=1 Tax=Cylindrobasidium torrendii FP15055 ss-10 TaxID=1314674 RepID=A0A0D7BIF4_9AGAR|nr:hypothetical protein CYLTODRAFT_392375 [Cylindrobasidium torrendii FP15055 ss-10]
MISRYFQAFLRRPSFPSTKALYLQCRTYASGGDSDKLQVSHSQFIQEAKPLARWKQDHDLDKGDDELAGLTAGIGKILPTKSHLFKLVLPPISNKYATGVDHKETEPLAEDAVPIAFLLHPSQPLSHIRKLLLSSMRLPKETPEPDIAFEATSRPGRRFEWSDSTDVADFVRDAARAAEFSIVLKYPTLQDPQKTDDRTIRVRVPTFADRTVFLRRRLTLIDKQRGSLEKLKRECDHDAHRGARRMAVSGFGMLVVYWGLVARLTFWEPDWGWDVMEPVTYLSGLSTVILGYLWFLYQGREVSYSSVLDSSISTRRQSLYQARGLDIERLQELISERRTLLQEIGRIAEDYEQTTDAPEESNKSVKKGSDELKGSGEADKVQTSKLP